MIGGSIAKELNHPYSKYTIFGVDTNESHCEQALELGLVESIKTLDEALEECQAIILAVPVDGIEKMLPYVMGAVREDQVVFDVGSTKALICKSVSDHPMRHRFVASHPLAGTEFSGPKAAHLNLFRGKKNIICEEELSDRDAVEFVEHIFKGMGMKSYFLSAEEHDKHMAFVSHLSHVSSFALSQTVLDIEKDEKQIFNLASTGFASTARLAKCNPITWTAIFEKNIEYLSEALDAYIKHCQHFKQLLDDRDMKGMHEAIVKANEIDRVLKGIVINKK